MAGPAPAVLPVPRLLSPAPGAVFDHYPRQTTVVWTEVPGAASNPGQNTSASAPTPARPSHDWSASSGPPPIRQRPASHASPASAAVWQPSKATKTA